MFAGHESFIQDSNGHINSNDLTIDTTDIAPYRYKTEAGQPGSRLSPGGVLNGNGVTNTTTKIGELIRQTASRKGQLSPNTTVSSTIVEESFRSISTTHQNIIFAQPSSKTLSELVDDAPSNERQYSLAVQRATDEVMSPRSEYQTSSGSYDYANNFENNGNGYYVEQPDEEESSNVREIKLNIDNTSPAVNRASNNLPSKHFVV